MELSPLLSAKNAFIKTNFGNINQQESNEKRNSINVNSPTNRRKNRYSLKDSPLKKLGNNIRLSKAQSI